MQNKGGNIMPKDIDWSQKLQEFSVIPQ